MPAPALVRSPLSRGAHPAVRRSEDWRTHAACIGLPDHAVFAREPEAARPALRACGICPVRRCCLEAVAPQDNWFDGVSGGRLWSNGRQVRVPADAGPARPGGPARPDRLRTTPAGSGAHRPQEPQS
ncbi:WhiB family transcriptional regulator [Streptomyces sp. NPDC048111]|uniref:WhiB family transcriptional regulator n=1 Tax=Streptomyces sp. NPDC048111 TaxID=3365500 RepID=UPI003715D148